MSLALQVSLLQDIVKVMHVFSDWSAQVLITALTLVEYLTLGLVLMKAMAPHSSTLAWKIPWTEEPGGLQSMGSLRVGQDSATSL